MALSKKYAGLPDLDPAPEIYETPELTDDASTIQTGTLRSEPPSPSQEGSHDPEVGLDRQRIDRDEARRRFDRAVVDARDVDFSDRIGANRKSYTISSRRRRHRQRTLSDTDGSSESEDESLPSRLARLRRETEELKIELEQRDNKNKSATAETDSPDLADDISQLSLTLDGLRGPIKRNANGPLPPPGQISDAQPAAHKPLPPETQPSTTTAIFSLSDRLTSLESALGITTSLPAASTPPILPTLTQLSTQLSTLSSTLTTSRHQPSSLPTLDELSTRVRLLVSETDKLTLSRKAALQSLSDLQEARLRNADSVTYGHSRHLSTQSQGLVEQTVAQQKTESKLFLDEQSSKISALYELLPTIQSLNPLLPTVLDRLRSLQFVHAGAAEARSDLEEIENRQKTMEEELKKWREGLDAVEKGMAEHEQTSKGNVEVVQKMVQELEGRLRGVSR